MQQVCQEQPQSDYSTQITTQILGELETLDGKGSWKLVLISYTTSNFVLKSGKAPTTAKINMKSN